MNERIKKYSIKDSPYGRVSILKELGEGVQMIVTTASVSAVLVTKSVATKMLSNAAKTRADEFEEELGYPKDEKERINIPMYELSVKNYIHSNANEIKAHFNNLIRLIPEYLRERGLIAPRPVYTLADKIADEYEEWADGIKTQSKDKIIEMADELNKYNILKKYFSDENFPLSKQGVLVSAPCLLDNTFDFMELNQLEYTTENLDMVADLWRNNINKIINNEYIMEFKKALDEETAHFERELQVARKDYINSVNLNLIRESGEVISFSMLKSDFEELLLTDEIKEEFAKNAMLDYSTPDYYGNHKKELFDALFLKRFNFDLANNWDYYTPQGNNGVRLEIESLSTEIVANSAYDELLNRSYIKEYISNNYENPEKYYEKLVEFAEKSYETINEVTSMLDSMRNKATEEQEVIETTENKTLEPHTVEAKDVKNLIGDMKAYSEPIYVVNGENPSEYVKFTYDNATENVIMAAHLGLTVANEITEDTLQEIVNEFRECCVLSSQSFAELNNENEINTVEITEPEIVIIEEAAQTEYEIIAPMV